MKTVIIIEEGKVTVEVDDQAPITVGSPTNTSATPRPIDRVVDAAVDLGQSIERHNARSNTPRTLPAPTPDKTELSTTCKKNLQVVDKSETTPVVDELDEDLDEPATPPPEFTEPTAEEIKERHCEVCDTDISDLHPLAKICQSASCINVKRRESNQRYKIKKGIIADPKIAQEIKQPGPPVPNSRAGVDGAEEATAAMDKLRANFPDPWNCEMCRNAGDLCVMHENLTKAGKHPPAGHGIQGGPLKGSRV